MNTPLIMKWHRWPRVDRDAWVSLFQPGEDEFDDGGLGCDWADGTRTKFEQSIWRMADVPRIGTGS